MFIWHCVFPLFAVVIVHIYLRYAICKEKYFMYIAMYIFIDVHMSVSACVSVIVSVSSRHWPVNANLQSRMYIC